MSFNRERGLTYAKQVAATRDKRKANQPNVFGKRPETSGTPAFLQHARSEIDDISEETKDLRLEEKKTRGDADLGETDQRNFKPGPDTGKTIPAARVTGDGTASIPELKSAFNKCWSTVDHINIPEVYHDDRSSWTPNGIVLFEVLHAMEELMNGNEELRWKCPNYFSLPVRVYYAVLFYVQVLRAKTEAGAISKSESSWLRAFFRRFRESMLPIAGPLVPYFTNITAVKPDDDQYEYVHPTIPTKGSYEVEGDKKRKLTVNDHHYLVPSVALIASLLRIFCLSTELGNDMFNEDGSFIPFDLAGGGEFAGINFPTDGGTDANIAALLTNPVLMHPLPENSDRMMEILGFWRRSRAKNIPDIPMNQGYQPNGPSGWTLISDDYDWFQPCVDMAHVQCSFFSDNGNLSEIPAVGRVSALIVAELKPDGNARPPTTANNWYTNRFSSVKAKFKATSADLGLDDIYESTYSLTNATLTWARNGHNIGTIGSLLRDGPYFENNKITYQLDHDTSVIRQTYTMVQTLFYDSHGRGGKN